MAYLKINGFHTATSGRSEGIGAFLHDVDHAGVPFFAYCVDGTTSLIDAQNIMQHSSVPHHAVFRRSHFPHNQGGSDVPNYEEPADVAAERQWRSHRTRWPGDLDPALIHSETVNELRKEVEWADWIGEFCYQTGLLALRDGFKWCGPGYSAGTPDEGAWETPAMLKFLDLCQRYPDRLAVALHEYSLSTHDIWRGDGNLIGRFQQLVAACERHAIAPPTIFFTEWGWAERDVPDVNIALQHILEVGELYAQYPTVKGAAIWGLDGGWGSLDVQTARLITPLKNLLVTARYPDPAGPPPAAHEGPPEGGKPREQYKRTYLTAPPEASLDEWLALCRQAFTDKQTVGFSYDDAGIGALERKTAVLFGVPDHRRQTFREWYAEHYPGTQVEFRDLPAPT